MMISPQTYRRQHEKDSIEELKKERDRLIKSIWKYEKGESPEEASRRNPSPRTVYSCNCEYLAVVLKMISVAEEEVGNQGHGDENMRYVSKHTGDGGEITEEQERLLFDWLVAHGHSYGEVFEAIACMLGRDEAYPHRIRDTDYMSKEVVKYYEKHIKHIKDSEH